MHDFKVGDRVRRTKHLASSYVGKTGTVMASDPGNDQIWILFDDFNAGTLMFWDKIALRFELEEPPNEWDGELELA